MENSCFFLGHRTAPAELRPVLEAAVERHVTEYGVTCFYVGRYGNFDRLAGRAVLAAKARHPGVELFLVLPYHPAIRPVEVPAGFETAPSTPSGASGCRPGWPSSGRTGAWWSGAVTSSPG